MAGSPPGLSWGFPAHNSCPLTHYIIAQKVSRHFGQNEGVLWKPETPVSGVTYIHLLLRSEYILGFVHLIKAEYLTLVNINSCKMRVLLHHFLLENMILLWLLIIPILLNSYSFTLIFIYYLSHISIQIYSYFLEFVILSHLSHLLDLLFTYS